MTTEILDCGHPPSEHESYTTGYGVMDGKRYCYDCCATQERETMIQHGKTDLYLVHRPDNMTSEITDWPGRLRFPVVGKVRRGWHNMAGRRYDADFVGPDGFVWHGTQYGNDTQIIHCKRTKKRWTS